MRKFLINFKYAFNPRKPLLILRLIWNFILMLVFKKQLLRYVDLAIGYRCNLNCEHCFTQGQRDDKRGRIPPSHYAKVVKECMRLGAVNFSFQGGEPLLYRDLQAYVEAAQPHKNLISITTNGTLLTYKKARELKSWGVDIVTISYDGMRDNSKFWNAFCNARKAGLKVTIGITASRHKINLLKTAVRVFSRFKVISMIIFPVPMGKWYGEDVMLMENEIEEIRKLEKEYPYIRTDFQANYFKEQCGAGLEILYITPYGDVQMCPFIPVSFGNIRYKSIKKIREEILDNKILNKNRNICIAGEQGGFYNFITRGKKI